MPAPAGEVVIGLDVGTSAVKAVAFAPGGWSVMASRDLALYSSAPGRQEQDPEELATAVVATLGDLVDRLGGIAIVGVATSAAMHGLVGLDEQRRPVTPLVTWADGRAAEDARVLASEHAELHVATGTPMHPMAPVATLRWFAREDPVTSGRVRWWLGLKDWVLLVLTGELVTERSSASGTGLLDRVTGTWHPDALAVASVTTDRLPRVVAVDTVLGLADEVADRTGLAGGLPVVAGAADGPLGNLGVAAIRPGVVGMSLGTSAAARQVVDRAPDDLDQGLFCYGLTDDAWVVGGAASTGGLAADWAADALAPDLAGPGDLAVAVDRDAGAPGSPVDGDGSTDRAGTRADPDVRSHVERLLELAGTVAAGSDGVVMLPHLLTPRAPDWHPDLAGTWLGVRARHDRRHLARAAIEGVALQLADIVDRLDSIAPVHAIRATGGALRAALWRRTVAAALDRPVTLVGDAGGTALGAAALGWWALGRATDPATARDALAPDHHVSTVDPDPADVEALQAVRRRRDALLAALPIPGANRA